MQVGRRHLTPSGSLKCLYSASIDYPEGFTILRRYCMERVGDLAMIESCKNNNISNTRRREVTIQNSTDFIYIQRQQSA